MKKVKLLILTRDQKEFLNDIELLCLENIEIFAPENEEDILKHIEDAEVIFWNPILLSKYINDAKSVKWVQSSFAWIDALNHPDLQKNYILTNMRDTYGEIIWEYILGYILMLEKNILWNLENQKNKIWWQKAYPSIVRKNIWIMGIGSIGKIIARYAKTLWMNVYWYATEYREQDSIDTVFTQKNQDEFLENLDYLINVLPNTENTKNIFNRALFHKLPNRSVFINVGRGASVVEEDLMQAIQEKQIAWAVLDVFNTEPLPKDSLLWDLENVYITPHISWYVEDNTQMVEVFAWNYERYRQWKWLLHTIDFNKWY